MTEIKAKDGMYLTQVAVADESGRVFVRRITGATVNAEQWKDATEADRQAWERSQEEQRIK